MRSLLSPCGARLSVQRKILSYPTGSFISSGMLRMPCQCLNARCLNCRDRRSATASPRCLIHRHSTALLHNLSMRIPGASLVGAERDIGRGASCLLWHVRWGCLQRGWAPQSPGSGMPPIIASPMTIGMDAAKRIRTMRGRNSTNSAANLLPFTKRCSGLR